YHHLILLAENDAGWKNLMKLVSAGFLEGFHSKPRIDKALLHTHREGLIALSGCLSGEVAKALISRDEAGATRIAGEYRDLMGADNYFLEIMDHGLPDQKTVARGLVALSRATGIPLVATNDGHYVRREDHVVQDVRICISTNARLDDPGRRKLSTDQSYLKSPAEMHALFAEAPEACSRTLAIAGRCHVTLPLGGKLLLPDYNVPDGDTLDSYLEKLCRDGLPRRYPAGPPREAEERITRELAIISRMGFPGYFLIVWDFINYARSQGIPVGPGRGSGAGSLVTYLLGITNVDPLRYGLLFERFLNPDRKSMPDLDIDVSDIDRGRVIEYVRRKYGENSVAQAITFSKL
ncbi:MAG: DNA polymerase III subunit alpha, partial [bacterium]